MTRYKTFRAELAPTLRLALPLVLAEVGWMSMAIVDTMMVGRLPEQRRSHRCGEPRRNSRQRPRHVRSWVADWAGHARLSSVWRRSARGLPSLASARHLSQLGACAVIDGPRLVFRSFASQHAHRSRRDRARSSLFKSTGLGDTAAPPLFRCTPLHAGYESGDGPSPSL